MKREASGKLNKPLQYALYVATLLGLLVIAGQMPAIAATYYVDGVNGNDANSGSAGQPWQSIGRGDQGILLPGDTVIVKAGEYNVTGLGVYLTGRHGTAAQPITYKAEGPGVIVQGATIGFTISTNYTNIEGFEIRNCLYGLEYYLATGGTARWNRVHDCGERGVAAVQSASPSFENNLVYNVGAACWCIHVEGCTGQVNILNNTTDSGQVGIIVFAGTAASTVKNNIMANQAYGLDHNQPSPITMTNSHNLFFNNGLDYLYRVSRGPGEFNASPRWVNPAAVDYTLDALSTAINTGTPVGLPFNGPAPDMGAFESTSTALPGYAVGKVTNAVTGDPLPGARVAPLDDSSWGITDANGDYRTLLAPGTYTLKASRPGYTQETVAGVVVNANSDTVQNFALTRVPVKTYYVSDASGNDSNDGSVGAPWKTIARGDELGVLNPGDTVLIAPGTYVPADANGVFLKKNSGEPGLLITYKANGGTVVIDQSANQAATGIIYGIQSQVSYLKIEGFEIRNCQYGIWFGVEHPGNEVANCVIHDLTAATGDTIGIGAYLNTGLYAHNNVIYNLSNTGGAATALWTAETSEVRIVNNTLVNAQRGILQAAPIQDANRIVVQNNIIMGMSQRGLWFGDIGNLNSHNVFYNNAVNYYGQATPGLREFGADPMLDGTYHLASGSPAVNVGVDVGLPFQGPAPDLGAFETSSTAVPGGVVGTVKANLPGTPPLPLALVALPGGSVFGVSGADGSYYLPLPGGSYTLEASAPGFVTASASGIGVTSGSLTTKNWVLDKGAWQTYYVDGTNGNDSNSGLSPGSAWRTITFGDIDDQLLAGDTVVVLPGTYLATGLGNQQSLTGGAPLAPITYKAQGPGVIIDGQGSAFGWVLWTNYVDLDGFEMVNCTYAVDAVNSSDHELRNCIVRDSVTAGLYTYGSARVVFRNNLIVDSDKSSTGIWAEGHTGFSAYNNTVIGGNRGIYLLASSNQANVRNNIISGNNTGLAVPQLGPVVNTNNLYWDNVADYGGLAAAGPVEFNANPMLDGSYKLTAGSPAIDAGVNIGLPFLGLAPDLGAFESSFSATPTVKHSIADAKAAPAGSWITIDVAQEATAASGGFTDGSINIEAADRATGIKVLGAAGVAIGDKITLTGQLGSDPSGEKTITASSVTVASSVSPLAAFSLGNFALSDLSLDATGLLVRTWGRVTFKAGDGSYIYIDDGKGLKDGTGHVGVRVRISGTSPAITPVPSVGSYLVVTGLAGLELDGATVVPVVRPRKSADVTTL